MNDTAVMRNQLTLTREDASWVALHVLRYKYWLSGAEINRHTFPKMVSQLAGDIGEPESHVILLFEDVLFECIQAGATKRPLPACTCASGKCRVTALKIVTKTCFANTDRLCQYVTRMCKETGLEFNVVSALAKHILLNHLESELPRVPVITIGTDPVTC